jgi:hypothetical protein
MKLSHTAFQRLKRHFYPTLVTAYIYEKENNKRKEGKKEGRILIHINHDYTQNITPTPLPGINFLITICWSIHIKKIWGYNVLPLV